MVAPIIKIKSSRYIDKQEDIESRRSQEDRENFIRDIEQKIQKYKQDHGGQDWIFTIKAYDKDEFRAAIKKYGDILTMPKKSSYNYRVKIDVLKTVDFKADLLEYKDHPNGSLFEQIEDITPKELLNFFFIAPNNKTENDIIPVNIIFETVLSAEKPVLNDNIPFDLGEALFFPIKSLDGESIIGISTEIPVQKILQLGSQASIKMITPAETIISDSVTEPAGATYNPILIETDKTTHFFGSSRFIVIDIAYFPQMNDNFEPILNIDEELVPQYFPDNYDQRDHGWNMVNIISGGYRENPDDPRFFKGYFITPFESTKETGFTIKSLEILKTQIKNILINDTSIKVINISLKLGDALENENEIGPFAKMIDDFIVEFKYKIVVVISCGQIMSLESLTNRGYTITHFIQNPSEIYKRLDNRICDPATSAFSIVVSNIKSKNVEHERIPTLESSSGMSPPENNVIDISDYLNKYPYWTTPETTRRGPTVDRISKPDFVIPCPFNDELKDSNFDNVFGLSETSYNAAIFSREILMMCERYPELNSMEINALIIANSEDDKIQYFSRDNSEKKDNSQRKEKMNACGFGIVNFHNFYDTGCKQVFLLCNPIMEKNKIWYIKVPIPTDLKDKFSKIIFGIFFLQEANERDDETDYLPMKLQAGSYIGKEQYLVQFWKNKDKIDDSQKSAMYRTKFENQIEINMNNPRKFFFITKPRMESDDLFLTLTIDNAEDVFKESFISIAIRLMTDYEDMELYSRIKSYIELYEENKDTFKILPPNEMIEVKEKKKQFRPTKATTLL